MLLINESAMEELNQNWITEGRIDFEYKKYVLLSYLQSTQKKFNEYKLYPFFQDLILHQQNLISIRDQKQFIQDHLPKTINGIDLTNKKINYTISDPDPDAILEIENIIDFALPKINGQIQIAKHIYDEADQQIEIDAVGIVPVYNDEGYLLFRSEKKSDILVYLYELSIFENNHELFRALKTTYFETYPHTIYNFNEAIKSDLIKKNTTLPNPATFVLHCKLDLPFTETLLPVAKRRFVRFLSNYKA